MNDDVFACPFCGGWECSVGPAIDDTDEAGSPLDGSECRAACGSCGAEGPPAATPAEAVRLWKTRVPPVGPRPVTFMEEFRRKHPDPESDR